MNMNSIMASQLRSLQSTVQLSVMNKALSVNASAVTEMLQDLQNQPTVHPYKGSAVDVKA